VLRSYREDATTIDGILDTGLYNCVSSAVLYMLAVRGIGIDVAGVRTSDHAFCTVLVGSRSVDVETTNPYGFDPGGKKEFKDSFGRLTGYAYVAPGGYGDRRAIGERELVGLILSNRASVLELSGRFAEATRLGADYAALCPGADSRAFQVDRINNLVASLEARRDFDGAVAAARAASAALPGEARLSALARTAAYNQAVALSQAGDWDAAFQAAARLAAASPEDAASAALVAGSLSGLAQSYGRKGDFAGARGAIAERADRAGPAAVAEARSVVGEMELVGAANGLPLAEAVAAADRILADGEISPARYAQAIEAIYGKEASRIGAGGDWLAAAAIADRGIAKLGVARLGGTDGSGDGSLARLAQTLRRNFVADAHNRFARFYNSGDYSGAKAALTSALASMPGDPTLTRDLAAAEAALSN
jgi:tetratricopeptide (TPR) repeat protein